jgi:hypothetical protein
MARRESITDKELRELQAQLVKLGEELGFTADLCQIAGEADVLHEPEGVAATYSGMCAMLTRLRDTAREIAHVLDIVERDWTPKPEKAEK